MSISLSPFVLATALWKSEDCEALLEVLYSGRGVFSPTKTLAEGDVFVRVSFTTNNSLVLSDAF